MGCTHAPHAKNPTVRNALTRTSRSRRLTRASQNITVDYPQKDSGRPSVNAEGRGRFATNLEASQNEHPRTLAGYQALPAAGTGSCESVLFI